MSSKRCPGKMLENIGGRPLLQRVIDRLRPNEIKLPIVVVTSDEESDLPLVELCKSLNYPYFCGPLDDVVLRYQLAARFFKTLKIVRVCGDSPWIDHRVVTRLFVESENGDFEMTTNVNPRTFPKGQSVEVFQAKCLENNDTFMDKLDKEHVTRYFYNHSDQFVIKNVKNAPNISEIDMTIDVPNQLNSCRGIHEKSRGRCWAMTYEELIKSYRDVF